MKFINGIVRAYTESQTRAALLFIEDAECYTHLLGNSSDMKFQLSVHSSFAHVTDRSKISMDSAVLSPLNGQEFMRVRSWLSMKFSLIC